MIFEQFEYGSLKFKYFNSSNNKYLLTLNDIIRFLFEKKMKHTANIKFLKLFFDKLI